MSIKIKIPEQGCQGCPMLKTEIIDHNYYGETSVKHTCFLFKAHVPTLEKCEQCKKLIADTEREEAQFYERLGNDIAQICKEVIDIAREEAKKNNAVCSD